MTEVATDFEIYRRQRAPRNGGATVTISHYGAIHFSEQAYELLGKPEAVVLLYRRGERVIGFRPAVRGEDAAYDCRLGGKSAKHTRTVSGLAFCRHIGLTGPSRRWPLVMEDGIGTVDLKQPGTPVTRNGGTR